jgi:hypothetical protein
VRAAFVIVVASWLLAGAAGGVPASGNWLPPSVLSREGALAPEVAVDADGDATVVMTAGGSLPKSVEVAYRPAGGLFAPPQVLLSTGLVAGPRLAVDAAGDAVVVWVSGTEGTVEAVYRRAGGSFGSPEPVPTARNAGLPAVALDAGGNAVVAWTEARSSETVIRTASRAAAGGWQQPQELSSAGATGGGSFGFGSPLLASAPDGAAAAIWTESRSTGVGLHSSIDAAYRARGAARFGTPEELADGSSPDIAIDATGTVIVAWFASGTIQAAIRPASSSWQPVEDVARSEPLGPGPRLAVDADGNAIAVWLGDNYAVDAATHSSRGWGAVTRLSSPGAGVYPPVDLAMDSRGDSVAVWREDDYQLVVAARRSAGGSFLPAADVSQAGVWATNPSVAMDEKGNPVAAWTVRRDILPRYDYKTYVQAAAYEATRADRPPGVSALSTGAAGSSNANGLFAESYRGSLPRETVQHIRTEIGERLGSSARLHGRRGRSTRGQQGRARAPHALRSDLAQQSAAASNSDRPGEHAHPLLIPRSQVRSLHGPWKRSTAHSAPASRRAGIRP